MSEIRSGNSKTKLPLSPAINIFLLSFLVFLPKLLSYFWHAHAEIYVTYVYFKYLKVYYSRGLSVATFRPYINTFIFLVQFIAQK